MTDVNLNATGYITTVRTMCTHSVSECLPVDFKLPMANGVTEFAEMLINTGASHIHGAVLNEDTDAPFAVITDFQGGALVAWDFDMTETDFSTGELKFRKVLTSVEFAAEMAIQILSGLMDDGVTVLGFDENGPFTL